MAVVRLAPSQTAFLKLSCMVFEQDAEALPASEMGR